MAYIEVGASLGYAGADAVDEIELPDDWDDLSDLERTAFIDDCLEIHVSNHLDSWARLVED